VVPRPWKRRDADRRRSPHRRHAIKDRRDNLRLVAHATAAIVGDIAALRPAFDRVDAGRQMRDPPIAGAGIAGPGAAWRLRPARGVLKFAALRDTRPAFRSVL